MWAKRGSGWADRAPRLAGNSKGGFAALPDFANKTCATQLFSNGECCGATKWWRLSGSGSPLDGGMALHSPPEVVAPSSPAPSYRQNGKGDSVTVRVSPRNPVIARPAPQSGGKPPSPRLGAGGAPEPPCTGACCSPPSDAQPHDIGAVTANPGVGCKRRVREFTGPGHQPHPKRLSWDGSRALGGGSDWSPIDHIFQFHRALRLEAEELEVAVARLETLLDDVSSGAASWEAVQQARVALRGKCRFLACMYRAHS